MPILNPADPGDQVGSVQEASAADVAAALRHARPWAADPAERAAILTRASELYEAGFGELLPRCRAKREKPRKTRTQTLPGPTGESNRLTQIPRGTVLCLGPTAEDARAQRRIARASGCAAIAIAPGTTADEGLDGVLDLSALESLGGFAAVALWGTDAQLADARRRLAARAGALIPLFNEMDLAKRCLSERHVCVDTTAAGGNASLLAEAS